MHLQFQADSNCQMSFMEEFIVSYPDPDLDGDFADKMGTMREFRSLLYRDGEDVANEDNADDPFFRNYQMLIGRWLAPWTNNRTMLIRWDPGVGKTRAALAFAVMWMRHSSHNKAILLSDQEIVHKALDDEVARYNRYDVELDAATYVHGRKSHGRVIANTYKLRKHGFDKGVIVNFVNNEIKEALDTSQYMMVGEANKIDFNSILADESNVEILMDHIRDKYANHVFIIDEVHSMRYNKGKLSYRYLMLVLDAVRDVCPILFLTATPIENSWKDAFSVVSMMYGPETRNQVMDMVARLPDVDLPRNDKDRILATLRDLTIGKVSYRDALGVVPNRIYVPPPNPGLPADGRYTIHGDGQPVVLEYMYPVFMGEYQTEIVSMDNIRRVMAGNPNIEGLEGMDEARNDIYTSSRLLYDAVGPLGDDGPINPQTLVAEDDGLFIPSTRAVMNYIDEDGVEDSENYFQVEYNEDGTINTDRGLGRYSIKYATMIDLLMREDSPIAGMAGYIHTLWVRRGIKIMAAALVQNGWEQYKGTETLTEAGDRPRFAVIYGDTTASVINGIIETFNSERNRDGSILRVVLGSKKSGISISFVNARFFIEMSSDFNKSKNIQSQGRVLRANALTWTRELGLPRDVIIMNMLALPMGADQLRSLQGGTISNDEYLLEFTDDGYRVYEGDDITTLIEERRQLADPSMPQDLGDNFIWLNPYTVEVWMYYLSESKSRSGQEVMNVLREASIETTISERLDLPVDSKNDAILYGSDRRHRIKRDILNGITDSWNVTIDPNNMYMMRSVAELMSSHTLAMNRYGMPRPVQSHGSIVSAYMASGCDGAQCSFNITYDRSFFTTSSIHRQEKMAIEQVMSSIAQAPDDEYEFRYYIGTLPSVSIKMGIIEAAIATPPGLRSDHRRALDSKRSLILDMYDPYWTTYTGGRVMHILWYGLRQISRAARIGINATPSLRTRELLYNSTTSTSSSRWVYMTDPSMESVVLTNMTNVIQDREYDVASRSLGYGFYVHMSIVDGLLRFKNINDDIEVTSVVVVSVMDSIDNIATIMDMSKEEVVHVYRDDSLRLARDIYYRAKELNLLFIK